MPRKPRPAPEPSTAGGDPPAEPARRNRRPRRWLSTALFSATGVFGLVVISGLGRLPEASPMWGRPELWLWLVSPHVAWLAAAWLARGSRGGSFVIAAGAAASTFGGLYLMHTELVAAKARGMSPQAVVDLARMAASVALVQWALALVVAGLTLSSLLRDRLHRRADAR